MYPFSVLWKITPLYFFSSISIYFAQKELIKMKVFETLSAQVKFCQIPSANFETTSRFLSKFCTPLQFYERLFLCTFFSAKNIYFAEKESIKMTIFETCALGSNFVKFLMPILKWQVDSSPNFVSLFSFMKDYSSVLF